MFKTISDYIRRRRTRRELRKKGYVRSRQDIARHGNPELADKAEHSKVLGIFMLLLLWGLCSLLLTFSSAGIRRTRMLVPGQEAPETLNAAFDFSYEDKEATGKARREVQQDEPMFFKLSEKDETAIRNNFNEFFAAVKYRFSPDAPDSVRPKDSDLPVKLAAGLDGTVLKILTQYTGNPATFRYFENELNNLLNGGILSSSVKSQLQVGQPIRIIDKFQRERRAKSAGEQPSENEAAVRLADAMLRFYPPSPDRGKTVTDLTAVFQTLLGASGNLIYDEQRTESGRKKAADSIGTVTSEVKKFHPIIRKGEVITENKIEILRLYNAENSRRAEARLDWTRPARNMFWSMMLVVLAGFYLYHIHPEVVSSNRRIGIVGSAIMLSLLCNYCGIEVFNWLSSQSSELQASLVINAVPLALIAILMAVFFGLRVAICTGFFIASVTALMLDMSFDFAFKGVVLCSLTALAVRGATNYRAFFMRTFFSVFPLVWILNCNILFNQGLDWHSGVSVFLQSGALALANGFATAVIAQLLVFFYELVFHVTTNMSLMLLCDYNHPLLERMKREAPGTFFHCLMVATLAEDAARAINGNYLRAKAGALYHDIGKLSKPQYFTENNRNVNWHEELTPQVSSIIIRDHVKEGLALAREYNLSRVIRDAIEQHHGNDLVQFFYRKAQAIAAAKGEDPVPESQFRYQGPPPKTKEAAIISLADACEAACRSLDKPSPSRIESLVDEILLKRYQGGQLSDADITLAELEKVRNSFVNTMLSMKHGRIAYQNEKEMEEDEEADEGDLFVAAGKNGKS